MNKQKSPIDPACCPLCNSPNQCANVSGSEQPCWCMAADVVFTPHVLQQVPANLKHKACICQGCAKKPN
ncbi:cysteine-rich CWC family protein [Alteromonas sp. C1M14]|uniref:cysteine-rich CWC family protein n=1 Tax=Alteromonas sp. C1M14 TaxID=2841567 RepID=UPI001C096C0A|nr:cysteine-rich CWC family protein [Alteromonas sp. C1M14]MBU2978915.1 cysteine-rich CWC family protein [Alteromonas sp. C1M14]